VTRTLRGDTLSRLSAEVFGLVAGIGAGLLTARWLGPSGKGIYASLTLLASLAVQGSVLGLGESLIVLTADGKRQLRAAFSTTLTAVLVSSALGGALALLAARWQFGSDWERVALPALIMAVGVPVSVLTQTVSLALNAVGQVRESSHANIVTIAVTTATLAAALVAFEFGVPGALAAGVLGSIVGAAYAGRRLGRRVSWRLAVDKDYLRSALRFGVVLQLSALFMMAAARADLLLVLNLLGSAEAGFYSVALTVGLTTTMASNALAYASFPRVAGADSSAAGAEVHRLTRLTSAFALVMAGGLAVVQPILIPFLFGRDFQPAVVPAVVLLIGGVPAATQWVLCRLAAARSHPGIAVASFSSSLVVMLLLDLVLIPTLGLAGAAVASGLSSLVGLLLAVVLLGRTPTLRMGLLDVVPRMSDFAALAAVAKSVVGGWRLRRGN
jgi:O-antigen/teichoic acid export membrane protein